MLVLPENILGKPVGFTCSTFDLLHAGHILMLAEAKSVCEYLIVGLQLDPSIDRPENKNKPVQSIVERYVQLSAVKFVDEIIVYQNEKDLEDLLMFHQQPVVKKENWNYIPFFQYLKELQTFQEKPVYD